MSLNTITSNAEGDKEKVPRKDTGRTSLSSLSTTASGIVQRMRAWGPPMGQAPVLEGSMGTEQTGGSSIPGQQSSPCNTADPLFI